MLVNFGYYCNPHNIKGIIGPLRGLINSGDDVPDEVQVKIVTPDEEVQRSRIAS